MQDDDISVWAGLILGIFIIFGMIYAASANAEPSVDSPRPKELVVVPCPAPQPSKPVNI